MARIEKHRHPMTGGYQRGEDTRARVIAGATRLFGERGFDGASTREIATSAGVPTSALPYYFGNKDGLYLACVEHVVSVVCAHMAEVIESAERAVAGNAGNAELIEAYCETQARVAEFTSASEETDAWRLLIARQQAGLEPSAGFQLFYQGVNKRVSAAAAAIVGRLLGRPSDDEETLIRTMALNGQLMMFHVMRRTALTTLDWREIDPPRVALLKRIVCEHTRTLLLAMAAERARDTPRKI